MDKDIILVEADLNYSVKYCLCVLFKSFTL
jgi:hypothetical protein